MAEPTSVLTFDDLTLAVAEKLGVQYNGPAGTNAASIPIDAQDLAMCQKVVNKAIRMYIHDGPKPNGWRWTRPVATLNLWGDVAESDATIVTAVANTNTAQTTLTVTDPTFYDTMELHDIVGSTEGAMEIAEYVSSTSVIVSGLHSGAAGNTFSIASNGVFTLPPTFGGEYLPELTFIAGTNKGVGLRWVDEGEIRSWRSNVNTSIGIPFLFAVRVMGEGSPRRRWELLAYPTPNQVYGVMFPYTLAFDSLVNGTEVHPAPFTHDEGIIAACLAQAEKEIEHELGADWEYYHSVALPNSYRVDQMAAPKTLGYFWNPGASVSSPVRYFREYIYRRPTVSVNVGNS